MSRQYGKNRKPSTIVRDNEVHRLYKEVRNEIGEYASYVTKSLIYDKIRQRIGLCTKTIAAILNHAECT